MRPVSDWSMIARAQRAAESKSRLRMRCLTRGSDGAAIESSRMPRPSSSGGEARVAGDLAADADRDARAQRRLGRELDQPQHRRVQRIVEMGHLLLAAVDGERVHGEIVGADGEEIGLLRQRVGGQRRARHLDHHAERRQRVGQLARRGASAAGPPVCIASRTWRISPSEEIIGSRMRNGPWAAARSMAPSWASSSGRSFSERRMARRPSAGLALGAVMAGQRLGQLVAADIERAHGHRPAVQPFDEARASA